MIDLTLLTRQSAAYTTSLGSLTSLHLSRTTPLMTNMIRATTMPMVI